MTITTKNLKVSTYDFESLTVSWEYEHQPPGVDLTTSTVEVQRSESADFSTYEIIANGLNANNTTNYTDINLSGVLTHRYNDMNYRVVFTEVTGTETTTQKVFLLQSITPKAKEIIRRKNLILRKRGLPVFFLKKKTYGQPCTSCYDELTGAQVTGNCSVCYNTGFIGGYYSPVSLKAFLTQTPDINVVNRFGEFNPGQMVFSIASYPELSVNDVVVDHQNRRWWINQIRNVSYRGYIVSQDATMSLVDHNDVIYDFAVT